MADTTSVKKYRDYAQEAVDEQAILDKYNAATIAQFNVQREQARQQENQFYNQMYDTQKTAMDTIRKANAAAVSSGASRGVQAAQELSALLGLEEESVASATELAQANRQIAQEETAATLENVLKAYQQATQERSQLVSQGIEAAAVDAEKASAQATAERADQDALQSALETGLDNYLMELTNQNKDYADVYSTEGATSLESAMSTIIKQVAGEDAVTAFTGDDWAGSKTAASKGLATVAALNKIIEAYGLNPANYAADLNELKALTDRGVNWGTVVPTPEEHAKYGYWKGKAGAARVANTAYENLLNKIRTDYRAKATTK